MRTVYFRLAVIITHTLRTQASYPHLALALDIRDKVFYCIKRESTLGNVAFRLAPARVRIRRARNADHFQVL